MKNGKLKTAMFEREVTHRKAAAILGINPRVFTNKINKRVVNGYEATFTVAEKSLLATEFALNAEDIE